MIYLATPNTTQVRDQVRRGRLGALLTPDSWSSPNGEQLDGYPFWAADNACYAKGDEFDGEKWLAWLEALRPYQESCLFAVMPDVVGDANETYFRSVGCRKTVRAMGYAVAYVAQEGVAQVAPPWHEIDAVFIGGKTEEFKFGEGMTCALEAKKRGLWTHMGRVNSFRRLRSAALAGIDSADGTYLAFGPDINLPKLLRWLDWLDAHTPLAFPA